MPEIIPPEIDEVKLTNKEYNALNAQASNYRSILRYVKAGGLDNFLAEQHRAPLDLLQTPDDMTGGESIMLFMKSIAEECGNMDQRIKDLSEALVDCNILLAKEKRKTAVIKKSLFQKVHDFIFVNPSDL
jgi:hypothetical protein